MFVEGQRVIYAGDTDPFQEVGAPGRVIALSGEAAHVQWTGGPKVGSLDLVDLHELVVDRQQAEAVLAGAYVETSRTPEPSGSLQVRAAYDEAGEDGVINSLSESGHLGVLASHAEDVYAALLGKIGADAGMRSVLAALEPDEADTVVARIASTLLVDRIREA